MNEYAQGINNEDILFTYRANNAIELYDPGTEVGGHPTLLALNNTYLVEVTIAIVW